MQKFKFFTLAIITMLSVNLAWGATYTNIEVSFTSSTKPTGWNTNGTFNSSYYKMTSGQYAETSSITTIIPSNEVLDSDFKVNVACGTFGTWTGDKKVTVTASLLDANGTTLSSGSQTYSSLNNTQTTYRGDITIAKPSDVSKIAKLKIVFSNFTTGTDLRFALLKLNYTTKASAPAVVRTVAWKVNNETYTAGNPTTQVNDGEAVTTLPTAPTIDCGGKTFVGWTATANYEHATAAPGDLFSTAAGAPAVSGSDVTYHAVFADASSSGDAGSKTLSFTYNSHANWTITTCTDKSSYYIINTNGSIVSPTFDVSNITQITANCRTFGGASYNTIDVKCEGTTLGTITAASNSLANANISFASPKPSLSGTKSLTFSTTTATTANGPGVASITITYTASAITYSNYTTTCATCTAISPTLSYTSSATIGQVLNPTLNKGGSSGAVTYSIKSGSSYASINASTGALTCSAAGTVTVQATIAAAGDYCEGTATSNTITISAPSYTVTAQSNNTSLGTVSGTTSITASPKTCVGYANPAYTVAPAGKATVAQNGNIFTVSNVTADVTVTINFAALAKDTYVDRLHNNADIEECGSYEAPSLPDAAKATTGDCDVDHYHFAGWVTSPISTGTPGAPSGMITAGTAMTSNGRTYIAVWAKEQ